MTYHKPRHSRGKKNNQRRSGSGPRRRNNRNKGLDLDPQLFVKKAVHVKEKPYEPKYSFRDFPLDSTVLKNITSRGFTQPTAIQDQAILPIITGKDLVGIANTGTGKTAAFLLPLITKIAKDRKQKVLIVTPTRELAAQIEDEFKLFSKGMPIYSTLCIGGASINVQRKQLTRNPQFVIGTPGRIKDLANRQILRLHQYNNVVLDEVDRMLDMGFIHDMKYIIGLLNKKRQSLFFSATMPEATKAVMHSFMKDHVTVSVKTGKTSHNVDQDIVHIRGKNKVELLHDLLIKDGFDKVLVFGRTKWGIKKLERELVDRGFKAVSIHGNKSQAQRTRALKQMKDGTAKILLATDVVARGIDIKGVTHVINFDVPESYDDYIHRIGRTGRAGKKGMALTFVN